MELKIQQDQNGLAEFSTEIKFSPAVLSIDLKKVI